MKSATVFSLLLAGSTVQGGLIAPKVSDKDVNWNFENKRQILGTLTSLLGKGGKVADPPGAKPRKEIIESTSKVAGAKRVKIRYGPYSVPNMNKNSVTGEAGSLWNYPDTGIQKPCDECVILAQQAGLEFPDGSNANIDKGMWLHHMVHFTIGPGRQDPTCFGRSSLPHLDVGATPSNSERYFSSGNERTKVQIDKLGGDTKFGYHVKPTDKMAFIIDLMNMNMEDKTVYMTMTYDILDGGLPAGWGDVKPVWFDANQCGTSEVSPPQQSGKFTITSGTWTPNFEGDILGVGGHLHDGGANLEIQVNNGVNCDSRAKYAETPEYKFFDGEKMGAQMGVAKDHISSMSTCYFSEQKVTKLSPDQKWKIQGKYDYDTFAGNKDASGKQEGIMAIAIMFVGVKPGTMLNGSSGGAAAPATGAPAPRPGRPAPPAAGAPKPAGGMAGMAGMPKAATPPKPANDMAGMAGMQGMNM